MPCCEVLTPYVQSMVALSWLDIFLPDGGPPTVCILQKMSWIGVAAPGKGRRQLRAQRSKASSLTRPILYQSGSHEPRKRRPTLEAALKPIYPVPCLNAEKWFGHPGFGKEDGPIDMVSLLTQLEAFRIGVGLPVLL